MTNDELKHGNLNILQPDEGPRINIDTVLLSDWVKVRPRHNNFIELGCATGAISLLLARKFKNLKITGLDIQPELIELANENLKINNLDSDSRIKFITGDLRNKNILNSENFDGVIMNPPYASSINGRISENNLKSSARHDINCTPEDLAECASRILKSKGRLFTVFNSMRLSEFLFCMEKFKLIPKRIKFIFPKSDRSSNIFLAEFIKDGGEGLEILPPLIIYDENNNYTQEINNVYKI